MSEQTVHSRAYLESHVSEHKKELIARVLQFRTRHITIVLEDIYQTFNASALVRTAEILGIQDIHVVETRNPFHPAIGISKGAIKWVSLHTYSSFADCFAALKTQGYSIVATTPGSDSIPLHDFGIDHKIALVFGTERVGLTEQVIALADQKMQIPMFGFTQSFNVSVSAAICLHEMVNKMHRSTIDWHLPPSDQEQLAISWLADMVFSRAKRK